MKEEIYLATVLLEKNRHTTQKNPSFSSSDWIEKIISNGFDGIELWGNHALKADESELEKLLLVKEYIKIFSSYCSFEDTGRDELLKVSSLINKLGIKKVKFNLGKNPAKKSEYKSNLLYWADSLADNTILLCECHNETIVDTPKSAHEFFHDLSSSRFQLITHPFGKNRNNLIEWFETFGLRLSHMHIQYRDDENVARSLGKFPDILKTVFTLLKQYNFAGTYSLEFTEGMNTVDETIEKSFAFAVSDCEMLRSIL